MESLIDLNKLVNYRNTLFNKYKKGIIRDISSVGYGSFYFIKQNKIKYKTKAVDQEDVVLNYLFWQILIERNTIGEKLIVLDEPDLEDLEGFGEIISPIEKKRDRIIKKIISSKLLKLQSIKEVKNNLLEIFFDEYEFPFYANKNNLKINNIEKGVSQNKHYIPFIYYQENF